MNLSKTKYCNGIQCNKMLWLLENKPEVKEEEDLNAIMDNGNEVHEVARDLFGKHINIEFNRDLSEMIEETNKYIKEDNIVITEGSFKYKNNFASIDILKKKNNEIEIYEVKSSTMLKDVFIEDLSYQTYILHKLGYTVTKCFVVHLNSNYKRKGELDLNKLFTIEDVTEKVFDNFDKVEKNINEINNYMNNKEELDKKITLSCFEPYKCPFFKYCTRKLPEHNVFDLPRMQIKKKIKFYDENNYSYEDLLSCEINDNYKKIIEYALYNKEDYINKEEIKKFIKTLSYPLYFLDFETYQTPIPRYDDMSPYEKIPFQYSLHYYEKENGKLIHKEFLSKEGIDPRRELAESLVNDIPYDVCTLAYNMGFEKSVIKALSELYPDLSDHLMNIHNNIKDLMVPFQKGYYYTKDMKGSYSIKYVLPSLFPNEEDLNYKNLDLIHNGSEAMNAFADLENKSKEEIEYIRERLLRYCELDTYAMVKIYDKLKKL